MRVDLTDVCDAVREYCLAVQARPRDGDRCDELLDVVRQRSQGFFFEGDTNEIDVENVRFANANSDLGLVNDRWTVGIDLPDESDPDGATTRHWFTAE